MYASWERGRHGRAALLAVVCEEVNETCHTPVLLSIIVAIILSPSDRFRAHSLHGVSRRCTWILWQFKRSIPQPFNPPLDSSPVFLDLLHLLPSAREKIEWEWWENSVRFETVENGSPELTAAAAFPSSCGIQRCHL